MDTTGKVLSTAGLLKKLCTVFLGTCIAFLVSAFGEAMSKQSISAEELSRLVLSQDCKTRYEAVMSFIKDTDSGSLAILEKEIEGKSRRAATYLREAMEFVRFEDRAGEKMETLLRGKLAEFNKKVEPRKKAESTGAETMKTMRELASFLFAEIESDKSPENQLILIGYLVDRFHHYHPDEEGKPFLATLDRIMSGRELRLRVFAAANLVFAEPTAKSKRDLVPILVEGLKSGEFPVRFYAQKALYLLTQQMICYNPLDPLPQRRQSIAAWEKWWKEESRKSQ